MSDFGRYDYIYHLFEQSKDLPYLPLSSAPRRTWAQAEQVSVFWWDEERWEDYQPFLPL